MHMAYQVLLDRINRILGGQLICEIVEDDSHGGIPIPRVDIFADTEPECKQFGLAKKTPEVQHDTVLLILDRPAGLFSDAQAPVLDSPPSFC